MEGSPQLIRINKTRPEGQGKQRALLISIRYVELHFRLLCVDPLFPPEKNAAVQQYQFAYSARYFKTLTGIVG